MDEMLGTWDQEQFGPRKELVKGPSYTAARKREPAPLRDGDPLVEVVWHELRQVLDDELGRLAQKYRDPLVLFYLEGKTTEEVARQLGCPKGTVLSRLSRGRDRLRRRLVRRGVAVPVIVMTGVLTEKAAAASVPVALSLETIECAVLTAAGQAAAEAIPLTVAALTKGVLQAMLLRKLKVMAAVALAMTIAVVGTVAVGDRPGLAEKTAAAKEGPVNDMEKIIGDWAYVSVEVGGQKPPAEDVKKAKMIFTPDGKFMAINGKGQKKGGTFKLDPAKKPKEMVTTNDNGKIHLGIYKLDEDTLTICMHEESGAPRPTEFTTKKGTKIVLVVLKREKDEGDK